MFDWWEKRRKKRMKEKEKEAESRIEEGFTEDLEFLKRRARAIVDEYMGPVLETAQEHKMEWRYDEGRITWNYHHLGGSTLRLYLKGLDQKEFLDVTLDVARGYTMWLDLRYQKGNERYILFDDNWVENGVRLELLIKKMNKLLFQKNIQEAKALNDGELIMYLEDKYVKAKLEQEKSEKRIRRLPWRE